MCQCAKNSPYHAPCCVLMLNRWQHNWNNTTWCTLVSKATPNTSCFSYCRTSGTTYWRSACDCHRYLYWVVFRWRQDRTDEPICEVCLQSLTSTSAGVEQSKVKFLECGHVVHEYCWNRNGSKCAHRRCQNKAALDMYMCHVLYFQSFMARPGHASRVA